MEKTEPRQAFNLLAIDIDGTLVNHRDRISRRTREALRTARNHIGLVLATGRRYRTTQRVMDDLRMDLPAVCLGGSLTKSASGKTLHAVPFAPADVSALTALAQRRDLALVLQRDAHGPDGPDFVVDASRRWNEATAHYVRVGGGAGYPDPEFSSGDREDTLVVGCFGERVPLAAFQDDIQSSMSHCESVLVPSKKTPGWYLEVTPDGVSKWSALRRYARSMGVAENAICAVGDALNDLPMIEGAGFGVAMGNADPAVKAAADWTTGRNDDDGLVALIERLMRT